MCKLFGHLLVMRESCYMMNAIGEKFYYILLRQILSPATTYVQSNINSVRRHSQ